MSHLPGQRDADLHHEETGEHRGTARTANGRDVEQHERRIRRHLAAHKTTAARLEYLRCEIRAERISYSELAELQSLADLIADDDVELLEWAGVEEGSRG